MAKAKASAKASAAKEPTASGAIPWNMAEDLKKNRQVIEKQHGSDIYRKALAGELPPEHIRHLAAAPGRPLPPTR